MRILAQGIRARSYNVILPALRSLKERGHAIAFSGSPSPLPREAAWNARIAEEFHIFPTTPEGLHADPEWLAKMIDTWEADLILTDYITASYVQTPTVYGEYGIPALGWQHGLAQWWDIIADHYLSSNSLKAFLMWGPRIHKHQPSPQWPAIGNSAWDSLPEPYDGGYILIVGATGLKAQDVLEEMEAPELAGLASRMVYRPHPETPEEAKEYILGLGGEVDADTPALDLIAGASLVVNTTYSTCALEAMLLGKPTISRGDLYEQSGTCYPVKETVAVAQSLLDGSLKQDYTEFVKDHVTPNGTKNFVEYIENLDLENSVRGSDQAKDQAENEAYNN